MPTDNFTRPKETQKRNKKLEKKKKKVGRNQKPDFIVDLEELKQVLSILVKPPIVIIPAATHPGGDPEKLLTRNRSEKQD